jgi:hypothetical protein
VAIKDDNGEQNNAALQKATVVQSGERFAELDAKARLSSRPFQRVDAPLSAGAFPIW